MARPIIQLPGTPPFPPKGGGNQGNNGGAPNGSGTTISPGLITSTGGLLGTMGAMLAPVVDNNTNAIYFAIWDPTIFDSEEDCIYYFPQQNIKVNYDVSSYKLILQYRNIGLCTITFNLSCFRKGLTTFNKDKATIQQGKYYNVANDFKLGTLIPDNLIYTLDVNIINPGQRPQAWIIRKANNGPFSLVSLSLYGNADQQEQL